MIRKWTMGLVGLLCSNVLFNVATAQAVKVAELKGTQITGVTVSSKGRLFVNAPNWRDGVDFSVAEISNNGEVSEYPNTAFNSCVSDSLVKADCFLAVQSVVAHKNKLYVLDTRNPKFKGVADAPRVFVVNLDNDEVERVLTLSKNAYHSDSYINDLRVDDKTHRLYMTDSGHAGLVVYNLNDNSSYRVLDNHPFTKAEVETLSIKGKPFNMQVQSDGIALDRLNETLYFHALSGYSLYAIDTADISNDTSTDIAENVRTVAQTGAPDGMLYHKGNLYLADLEKQQVQYLTPSQSLETLVEGSAVNWADTFSVYENTLYYTNSKIQDAGDDVSDMSFEVYKVPLPAQ